MAGGGVRGGIDRTVPPTTRVTRRSTTRSKIHDLHATMLHLLGIDHTRARFVSARDMRLTDVHGHVIHDIVA